MNAETINRQKTMQLASSRQGQPWACTVYFVLQEGNFYWLSLPERRHSQELADNPKAAVAVAIKHDKPVVGVQAEGDVTRVRDTAEMQAVLDAYVDKYGQGKQFARRFVAGENQHQLYRLRPRRIIAFDEQAQPDSPYQEITV